MPSAKFTYSKNEVSRAGDILVHTPENIGALDILTDFRSAHIYPLSNIQDNLRKIAKKSTKNPSTVIISQRLKRMPSILAKLERQPGMSLARMQDIGGCRAIFPTVEDVYTCQKNMLASRMQHNPPKNHKDYIESPKESGYRGIHIVYEFTSKSQKYATYNGMLVEVQLRTVVQHAWATAVETVGIFTGESLKSSTGSPGWLEFFQYASTWMAICEGYGDVRSISDLRMHIRQYMEDLHIHETLLGFSHTIRRLENIDKKDGYILLDLDVSEKTLSLLHFPIKDIHRATEMYNLKEQRIGGTKNHHIVLFSLESAKNLRKAYPNYFGDTDVFMQNLMKIFDDEYISTLA